MGQCYNLLQSMRYWGYSLSCDGHCCFSLFKFLEFKREDWRKKKKLNEWHSCWCLVYLFLEFVCPVPFLHFSVGRVIVTKRISFCLVSVPPPSFYECSDTCVWREKFHDVAINASLQLWRAVCRYNTNIFFVPFIWLCCASSTKRSLLVPRIWRSWQRVSVLPVKMNLVW